MQIRDRSKLSANEASSFAELLVGSTKVGLEGSESRAGTRRLPILPDAEVSRYVGVDAIWIATMCLSVEALLWVLMAASTAMQGPCAARVVRSML